MDEEDQDTEKSKRKREEGRKKNKVSDDVFVSIVQESTKQYDILLSVTFGPYLGPRSFVATNPTHDLKVSFQPWQWWVSEPRGKKGPALFY